MVVVRDDLIFEKSTIDTESLLGCSMQADELIEQGYTVGNCQRQVPCPIYSLHVAGHPIKSTRTERKWFERNVESFSWI